MPYDPKHSLDDQVHERGLDEISEHYADYLISLNEWHDAADAYRHQVANNGRFMGEALRQYHEAVRKTAGKACLIEDMMADRVAEKVLAKLRPGGDDADTQA